MSTQQYFYRSNLNEKFITVPGPFVLGAVIYSNNFVGITRKDRLHHNFVYNSHQEHDKLL